MIGRRGVIGGLAAMAGGRFLGGDPGTGRGSGIRGGLPGPRPDQQYRPVGPQGPVGSSTGIVKARILISFGTGQTGFFQYNGNPALGNPPVDWAVPPGVTKDLYGNTLATSGGFASAGPGNIVASFFGAIMSWVNSLSPFSSGPSVSVAGGGIQGADFQLKSGAGTGGTQSFIDLKDSVWTGTGSLASVRAAQATVAGPTATGTPVTAAAQLEVQGVFALTEQSSAPPTPVGGGYFYVDATGHFVYKGPSGTVTVLANP